MNTPQPRMITVPAAMTEREWQTVLQDRLTAEGYLWQHVYRMQTARGTWRTSTTSVGWPDLVAMKGEHVIAIECKKSPKDHPTPEQVRWLTAFTALPTGRAWVLRATDDWQKVANWIHQPWKSPEVYGWLRPADVASEQ